MNIYWRIASYGIAIAASFALVSFYADRKRDEGIAHCEAAYTTSALKQQEKSRAETERLQKEADEKFAKYESDKIKTDAAYRDLSLLYGSLQRDTEIYKRRLSEAASNPAGAARTGRAGLDNYQSCRDEYGSMGAEFARVSDRLNGLIEQCKIAR